MPSTENAHPGIPRVFLLCALTLCLGMTQSCKPPTRDRTTLKHTEGHAWPSKIPQSGTIIYYVPMNSGKYWLDIMAGMRLAERKLKKAYPDLKLLMRAPSTQSYPELQIQIIDEIIQLKKSGRGKVDGILLAPQNDTVLLAPVLRAHAAGIPIILLDANLADKEAPIESFIASDNYDSGRLAAEFLATILKDEEITRVLIFTPQARRASTNERVAGFTDAIARFPHIRIIHQAFSGDGREKASRSAINLLNTYGQEIDAIYATDMDTTEGMIVALLFKHAERNYKFIGFDSDIMSRDAIRNTTLTGLVMQDPVEIGEKALRAMLDVIAGKPVERRITTEVFIANSNNVKSEKILSILRTRKEVEIYNELHPPNMPKNSVFNRPKTAKKKQNAALNN